jgi:DNA replication and repair protein RecF
LKLVSIEFTDFRNLAPCRVELGPRFNLVLGDNAQGKTNFLEALAVACELRSFRATRLEELLAFDCEQARLAAYAECGGLDFDVRLELSRGARRVRVNGKAVTRQKDYVGQLPAVIFEPDDVRLSKGGPQRRRSFLDTALFLVQPSHWDASARYRQVLKRRNLLLKERKTRDAMFEVYSEQLAKLGAQIAAGRLRMCAELNTLIGESVARVSDQHDRVALTYESHLPSVDGEPVEDGGQTLLGALNERTAHDRELGYTTVGPHVEDLLIHINDQPAARFASQGQHRTVALALKIAEIEIVHQKRGVYPLLLIDDLSSELDAGRRTRLFEYLTRSGSQVVLTSTDPDVAAGFAHESLSTFTVSGGRIHPSQALASHAGDHTEEAP